MADRTQSTRQHTMNCVRGTKGDATMGTHKVITAMGSPLAVQGHPELNFGERLLRAQSSTRSGCAPTSSSRRLAGPTTMREVHLMPLRWRVWGGGWPVHRWW
eukprot:COSAG01_NODE_3250_length_6353_cov_445.752958_3_plen_102_part_00